MQGPAFPWDCMSSSFTITCRCVRWRRVQTPLAGIRVWLWDHVDSGYRMWLRWGPKGANSLLLVAVWQIEKRILAGGTGKAPEMRFRRRVICLFMPLTLVAVIFAPHRGRQRRKRQAPRRRRCTSPRCPAAATTPPCPQKVATHASRALPVSRPRAAAELHACLCCFVVTGLPFTSALGVTGSTGGVRLCSCLVLQAAAARGARQRRRRPCGRRRPRQRPPPKPWGSVPRHAARWAADWCKYGSSGEAQPSVQLIPAAAACLHRLLGLACANTMCTCMLAPKKAGDYLLGAELLCRDRGTI